MYTNQTITYTTCKVYQTYKLSHAVKEFKEVSQSFIGKLLTENRFIIKLWHDKWGNLSWYFQYNISICMIFHITNTIEGHPANT